MEWNKEKMDEMFEKYAKKIEIINAGIEVPPKDLSIKSVFYKRLKDNGYQLYTSLGHELTEKEIIELLESIRDVFNFLPQKP